MPVVSLALRVIGATGCSAQRGMGSLYSPQDVLVRPATVPRETIHDGWTVQAVYHGVVAWVLEGCVGDLKGVLAPRIMRHEVAVPEGWVQALRVEM